MWKNENTIEKQKINIMTPLKTFLLILSILLISCSPEKKPSENTNNKDAEDKVVQARTVESNKGNDNLQLSKPENSLRIKGDNIWIRDEPGTGEVVMKLNDGTMCEYFFPPEHFEIIRSTADYWLKIKYDGKFGWVFGSQTSLKQEKESNTYPSIESIIDQIEFDSSELPDSVEWDGDPSIIKHLNTFKRENFAIVSFDQPGYMAGRNFSIVAFRVNDQWIGNEISGEIKECFEINNKLYALLFIKSTGGAYTLNNDLKLYRVEPSTQSFRLHQEIFSFASSIESGEVGGKADIKFSGENNEFIEITEYINYKDKYTYRYQFDRGEMKYDRLSNDSEYENYLSWIKENLSTFSYSDVQPKAVPSQFNEYIDFENYTPIALEKLESKEKIDVILFRSISTFGEPTYDYIAAIYKDKKMLKSHNFLRGEDMNCPLPIVSFHDGQIKVFTEACSGDYGEPGTEFNNPENTYLLKITETGALIKTDNDNLNK